MLENCPEHFKRFVLERNSNGKLHLKMPDIFSHNDV